MATPKIRVPISERKESVPRRQPITRQKIRDGIKFRQSVKLYNFSHWERIQEVHQMMDAGVSAVKICKWVNENGFSISDDYIRQYMKMRKQNIVDGISMSHVIGVTGTEPSFDPNDPSNKATSEKLKSEIDALDLLIQKGYNTLTEVGDKPISPGTMMAAIRLKNDLTDGSHGFLTNFGMEQLREIEQRKYALIIDHLMTYIPDEFKQEAVSQIPAIEENYYYGTAYYEEYLKATGEYTDEEMRVKIQQWIQDRKAEQTL